MSIPKVKRFENGKEIVGQVDTPYEITWDEWQELTEAQKKQKKWLITDVPGANGYVEADMLKLLWSNPAPTASFVAQNITLNSSDYDFLYIAFSAYDGNANAYESVTVPKGKGCVLSLATGYRGNENIRTRQITYVSDTSLSIGDGYLGQASATVNNATCVPIAIYGFKKTLTLRIDALAENVKATVDYSTDEHAIGTWIDGSILYEKTVNCGTMPNATTKAVAHGISNLSWLVSIEGTCFGSNTYLPLPFVDNTALTNNIRIDANSVNIAIRTSGNFSSFSGYVTLRYTKNE